MEREPEKIKVIELWKSANTTAMEYDVSLIGKRQEALYKWYKGLMENAKAKEEEKCKEKTQKSL